MKEHGEKHRKPADQRTRRAKDQETTGPDQDQRTKGPKGLWTRGPKDQGTRGPKDQWTKGPEDQRTHRPQGQDSSRRGLSRNICVNHSLLDHLFILFDAPFMCFDLYALCMGVSRIETLSRKEVASSVLILIVLSIYI